MHDEFRFGDGPLPTDVLERVTPRLVQIARLYTTNADDAADIIQDTWVKAMERRESFNGRGTLEGWIITICKNACKDWARKNGETPDRMAKWVIEHVELPSRDPEAELLGRRTRSAILEAVATKLHDLTPKEREAINLRFVLELDPSEAAMSMGVTQSTLRTHLASALGKLRSAVDWESVA